MQTTNAVKPIPTVLTLFLTLALCATSWTQSAQKTKLRVLLYPWVPEYGHIAKLLEDRFEAENPTVDLVVSEQNWDYYEPGGLDATYDVYELDGIYLHDFVVKARLQPLESLSIPRRPDVLKAAANAVVVDGSVYGLPHWTCALFLFYFTHDTRVAEANTRAQLITAIGRYHERGRGLLVDWKGHSTLTGLYADCLLDLGLSPSETLAALAKGQLNPRAKTTLSEFIALSDVGSGRSDVAHNAWPPYYAIEFAHARGRALVGYSERMYHILQEIGAPTDSTPVVDPRTLSVKLFNQGEQAGVPLLWVDSFAIARETSGAKLDAAKKFLMFAVRDDIYRAALLPAHKAPQYLLPAYSSLFSDAELVKAAPLYPKLLPGLGSATSLVGKGLPQAIEKTGTLLDQELPVNLQRK